MVTTGAVWQVDPAHPATAAPIAFDTSDAAALGTATAALPEIEARLAEFAAHFETGLPAKADLLPFFVATGFRHDGLGLDAWLDDVVLLPHAVGDGFDYVGYTVGHVTIARVLGPAELVVSFTASVRRSGQGGAWGTPYVPWSETMRFVREGGRWVMAGNGRIANVHVGYRARVFAEPLTVAELDARPDVVKALVDPQGLTLYQLKIPGVTDLGVIGFPGDAFFGYMAWVGASFDDPSTAGVNERELRRQKATYLARPSARVITYLTLEVSSVRVDPLVASVKVTGPGMPAGGITLVRPSLALPREYLPIKGDPATWNTFSTERCPEIAKPAGSNDPNDLRDPIPGCALDWSAIAPGSEFTFRFLDAAGALLEEVLAPIVGTPRAPEEWLAQKDTLFPLFTLAGGRRYTIANVLDTSAGASFRDGGTVSVSWKLPSDRLARLQGVALWRQYFVGDDYTNAAARREDSHWYPLYGSGATAQAHSFVPNGCFTSWAWATLMATDLDGNVLEHEVSPLNPY
jgi:hypothetical protein